MEAQINQFFHSDRIALRLLSQANLLTEQVKPFSRGFEPFQAPHFYAVCQAEGGHLKVTSIQLGNNDTFGDRVSQIYREDLFQFASERYSVGSCERGYATRLLANASNLPAVLDTLKGERGSVFERLIEHMRDIFPSFGNMSIRPSPDNTHIIEILIWPEAGMQRGQLAFSLAASGTGLAQVLSILTAVMTLDHCVILIDEINSFLHPAATKALLRILTTRYAQHQYIISTHAAEVISFAESKATFVVKKTGYISSISNVNLADQKAFRNIAGLLGISMADVFSADTILWVEGPTEELCFSYLYTQLFGFLPRGFAILSVTTGDFFAKKRDKKLIFEIYSKLSSATNPLMVKTAFSFDREKLNQVDREDMIRESKGLMHFLPRRHIECYALHVGALCAFVNDNDTMRETQVSESDVETCIINLAKSGKFATDACWNGSIKDRNWLSSVDAANLIDDCCSQLTDYRVTFLKKQHTLKMIVWIFEHEPEFLAELSTYYRALLGNLGR